jgi:diacylglycerol kinase (ATP)
VNTFSHVVVIFNPNSTGPSDELASRLENDMRKLGVDVPILLQPTERAGHARQLAYDAAKQRPRPLIVSVSGDGGYNEVINGALKAQFEGAQPVCAVLAAGNANDHRRTIAKRPLAEAIAQGEVEHIDVLNATVSGASDQQRFAHSYIGVGLTPAVAIELNKTSLNRFKETLLCLKTFRDFHPVEIRSDGKTLVLDSLIFANIGEMAKVMTVAENAEPDDGRFEVVVFPYKHKLHLLWNLVRAVVSGLKGTSVTRYEFEAVKSMALQLDGEVIEVSAGDRVQISVNAGALATVR